MDRDVFRNPRVVAWLQKNVVCVRLDAEADAGQAMRLKLGPYPSHVFIKNGELIDRMDGYLTPSEFLNLAKGAARGRTTGERIEDEFNNALRNGADKNADVRYSYAQKLLDAKRYDAATKEFVFLWSNIVSLDPRYAKSRHDMAGMAGKIKELVSKYQPAREAFTKLRNELTPKVDPNLGVDAISVNDLRDWVVLNDILRDWPTVIGWAKDVADNHDHAILEKAGEPLYDVLRTRFQWRLMGLVYSDPYTYLNERKRAYADRLKKNPVIDSYFIEKISNMYAALLAADRVQDAIRVAHYAIDFKDNPATRDRLADAAALAGIPKNLQRVWETADEGPQQP